MYIQALIALAVVIGMVITIVLLGKQPSRPRRTAHAQPLSTTPARPDVTRYGEQQRARS